MSDESDVKILVELSHLSHAVRAQGEGQGRLLEKVDGVQQGLNALALRVGELEIKAGRAEKTANEAKRAADGAVHDTGEVHKAWQVHAAALRLTVDSVQAETVAQSAVLAEIQAANHEAALHRKWQVEQAEAAKSSRTALLHGVKFWLGIVLAIGALLAMLGGGVSWVRAHWAP